MKSGERETSTLFKTTEKNELFYGELDTLLLNALNFRVIKYCDQAVHIQIVGCLMVNGY